MKTYITEAAIVLGGLGAACLAVGELIGSTTWTAIGTFCTVFAGSLGLGRISKKLK